MSTGKTQAQKYKPRPMKERNDHAIATFEHLYAKIGEINSFQQQWPTISNFPTFKKERNRWRGLNDLAIARLNEGIKVLLLENVQGDENEWSKNDTGDWNYKSSAHKEAFEIGWKELMKTPCTIVL